jgi:hypothetical protein
MARMERISARPNGPALNGALRRAAAMDALYNRGGLGRVAVLAGPDRRPRGRADHGAGASLRRAGDQPAGGRPRRDAAAPVSRAEPDAVPARDRRAVLLLRAGASVGLGRSRRADGGARLGRYRGTALRDHRDGGLPAAAAPGPDVQQLVRPQDGGGRVAEGCTSWSTPPRCWARCTTCGWRRASSWSRFSTWRRFWGCSPCVCARRVARLAPESPGFGGIHPTSGDKPVENHKEPPVSGRFFGWYGDTARGFRRVRGFSSAQAMPEKQCLWG